MSRRIYTKRYQNGSLQLEKRKKSPDIWIFRHRNEEGSNLKEKVGTLEQFPTRKLALQQCELLRSNINRDVFVPRTVKELVEHYQHHELPNKTPYTQEVYNGYLSTHLLPRWQDHFLSSVKPVVFEAWLKGLKLAAGTKAKLRNLMHSVFTHGMRWEFVNANPISLVRQSAKRERTPDVLTADEVSSLLKELSDPWRTAVYVAVVTGLRVSELLGLKWSDIDFVAGEITLRRGIVRQNVGEMKTEASRKPVPLDSQLAEVLIKWRSMCPYNQNQDWIFASPDMHGTQPYWPTAGMEKHIRPAAARARITTKRIGWHTLRHTFGTLVKSQGADVATTQSLMRHANVSITMDRYVQAISGAKREAQSRIVQSIPYPNEPRLLTDIAVSG